MTGITRDHQFLVIEKPSARSNSDINNRMIGSSHENSDSSIDDEFEDAADFNNDDDLFRDTTPYNPLKPLSECRDTIPNLYCFSFHLILFSNALFVVYCFST